MYLISKEFHFSASHQHTRLPKTHKCNQLHGHNYIVVIELVSSDLDEHGFVRDYGDLNKLRIHIDNEFDHRHLNDILGERTTAENLARYFYNWCKQQWPETHKVRVSETPKTWAEYKP